MLGPVSLSLSEEFVVDGRVSLVEGVGEAILYSFIQDQPRCVVSAPER